MVDNEFSKQKINEINRAIYKNNFVEAKKLIENYKLNYGIDSYILLEEGKVYRLLEQYDEAISILMPLIEESPKNIGYILYEIGICYKAKGKIEQSLEYFLMIEKTSHKNKEYACYEIGLLYYKLGSYSNAEKYFNRVIYNEGVDAEKSKIYLAKIKMALGKPNEALNILNEIIYKNNSGLASLVLYNKAKIYAIQEKYEDALDLLHKIINTYDKKNIKAYTGLISIYCVKDDLKEATYYYNKIKNEDIISIESLVSIAEYKTKLGLYDEARDLYETILKTANADNYYINILRLSRILMSQNKLEEAKQYLNKIINTKYHNQALFRLSIIELKEKNFLKSFEYFSSIDNVIDNKLDLERIKLMLIKELNMPTVFENTVSYSKKQIINYDRSRAIKHIKKHTKKEENPYFNSDIDINKLYDDIKPYLVDENIYEIDTFIKYKIKYPNIGKHQNKDLNELIVVTKLYNNDIITMYPIESNEILEEKEEYTSKNKVKRLSQVEKFNLKYKK